MSRALRQACAQFATGITVATVRAAGGSPHGLTVSSFTCVSIHPPLILICIDYACDFLPHFRSSDHFAVNILAESQRDLSITFAEKPEGRFDGVDWYPGATGVPLLRDCLATFECRVTTTVEAGDHAVFIGEVIAAESREGNPLIYFNRAYRTL